MLAYVLSENSAGAAIAISKGMNGQKAFVNATEGNHLLHLAQSAKASVHKGLRELAQQAQLREQFVLSEDLFGLVSEWYHFAILNLLECDGFQWKAPWIASRLGISRIQAQMAMDLLLRMDLVTRQKGRYVGKSSQVSSSAEIPSGAIRSYHRQILEKAILALEAQSVTERDISGCGFAVDSAHLPAIKKELSDFQDRLLAKYSRGNKTEVYFLEMALFKLTQGGKV